MGLSIEMKEELELEKPQLTKFIMSKQQKEIKRLRGALEEVFELSRHDNQSRYLDKCYVIARQALKDVE